MTVSRSTDNSRLESDTNKHRYEYEQSKSPSEAILDAVAAVSKRPITPSDASEEAKDALPPLYKRIDPDALDALFGTGNNRQAGCTVTFAYCDFMITVQNDAVFITRAPY